MVWLNKAGEQNEPTGVVFLFRSISLQALLFYHILSWTDTSESLVGVVGNQKCSIHWLHTARAGEAPHQPVIDTLHMVGVHAGQVAHWVPHIELDHTNDALSVLLATIKCSSGQVLYQSNPLGYLYLLLLSQLAGRPRHVWGRIVDRSSVGLLNMIKWRLLQLLHTGAGVGVGVPQQGDVVCRGGLQAVAHPSDPGKHGTKTTGEKG